MKEKKYIDRLYQEKFRDFEATPREAVWKSLSKKLQEKEPKKPMVRPLWSRIAGVAAIISLFVLIGDWILQPQQNRVVNTEEELFNDVNDSASPTEVSVAETNSSKNFSEDPATTEEFRKKDSSEDSPQKSSGLAVSSIDLPRIGKETSNAESGKAVATASSFEKKAGSAASTQKKSIYDDLNQFEHEEKISSNLNKKIKIRTHAAPIYYGNFGSGNFLDSQFDNKSNEGEVTYSYGVNVAYAFSEKLKIRSGINKVSMSYNTSNISYHSVVNPLAVSSINYRSATTKTYATQGPVGGGGMEPVAASNRTAFGNLSSGLLNQKLGYLEVPLELEYKLIDKKFELNLIGGASTLFLDENMISVNSGTMSTNLGEANNLNSVSFSTNIGVGLDYNLSRQFKLNLEPMFKYQLNTFNTSAGDYQPFYLGIYSGFSFEF